MARHLRETASLHGNHDNRARGGRQVARLLRKKDSKGGGGSRPSSLDGDAPLDLLARTRDKSLCSGCFPVCRPLKNIRPPAIRPPACPESRDCPPGTSQPWISTSGGGCQALSARRERRLRERPICGIAATPARSRAPPRRRINLMIVPRLGLRGILCNIVRDLGGKDARGCAHSADLAQRSTDEGTG